ncbi:EAL domain-containing protein [Deinococcus cavernae]|uniref:EAL domain-containing protein n=1 Tax=Deinococcus cavernae TaxID=2320857 RepID=A0A418V6B3_9DEIO|nr:EAL domain-containing protein [Deinococcus cavernae]RJF71638.1 EAL domain-containing protein [Deinococcus cavernae]
MTDPLTVSPAAFERFVHTHGLDPQSPPSPEKWQALMQVLRTQLGTAGLQDWRRHLMELQWPTFITSLEGTLQSWNDGCVALLGHGPQVVGQALDSLLSSPLEGLRLEGLMRRAGQGERLTGVELRFPQADGSVRLTVCSVALLPAMNGSAPGLVFTCAPLGAEQGTVRDTRQSFYETLLRAIPAPLTVLNPQGQYVFCNAGAIRDPEIRAWIIGKTDEEYMNYRQYAPSLLERRQAHYQQAIRERRSVTFEETFENTPRGRVVQSRTLTPVFDEQGELAMTLGYGLEITELRAAQEALQALNEELEARVLARTAQLEAANRQIQHDAFHDALTGLPNRALFTDRLEQAVMRSGPLGQPAYAVLLLDTDRFKGINDTLGHPAGDALLQQLAGRLRATVRTSDTVARQGGDEFTILVGSMTSPQEVLELAQRLQRAVREPMTVGGEEVVVSVSVGIVLGDAGYTSADEVLRDADIAMYRAKAAGRGGSQVFRPEMREQTIREGRLEQELRAALLRDELRLVYQPIIELSSHEVAGFEALVRWQHPRRGLLGPAEFLPVAAESGLAQDIDRWVLRRACLDMSGWQRQHPQARVLSLSVNFSAEHFNAPDTVAFLREVLSQTGFDPQHLNIEITEGVLLGQPQAIGQTLRDVQALGVKLHLDDFGTGYSSLSYLHNYPLNTLKIDRSFVASMLESRSSSELVRTIVSMTKNMNLSAVAEGVENQEQMAALEALGCEFAQGYYFSRPLPLLEAGQVVHDLNGRRQG